MRDVAAELRRPEVAPVSIEDERALRDLSARYASAVDRREGAELAALFLPTARLAVYYPPDEVPERDLRGRDEIAAIARSIAAYDATFHFLGQSRYGYEPGGVDAALGEVHCDAVHLQRDRHGGIEFVMHIRYQDRYERVDGAWHVAERELAVDWTATRTANPARFRRG